VRANAAEARVAAYIAPGRCILGLAGTSLSLWLNDGRDGETVHATEIRWLTFDYDTKALNVQFVTFPPTWTQVLKDVEDHEYPLTSDWLGVLEEYTTKGYIATVPLVDGLEDMTITLDDADPLSARHVQYLLQFETTTGTTDVNVAATIRLHHVPVY